MSIEPMTLEEVENCDSAYLVYDQHDPDIHLFKRIKTYDSFIAFDREHQNSKGVRIQPHLWKDLYGTVWWAYKDAPAVNNLRRGNE